MCGSVVRFPPVSLCQASVSRLGTGTVSKSGRAGVAKLSQSSGTLALCSQCCETHRQHSLILLIGWPSGYRSGLCLVRPNLQRASKHRQYPYLAPSPHCLCTCLCSLALSLLTPTSQPFAEDHKKVVYVKEKKEKKEGELQATHTIIVCSHCSAASFITCTMININGLRFKLGRPRLGTCSVRKYACQAWGS